MTDPLGQSQVIPYLIGLSKKGFEFTILSCEKPARFSFHKNEIENLLKPFSIKWVSVPYHKKPYVFSTVYDMLMLKRKAKKLHKKERFDMVHTRTGTPALVGLWMKEKFRVKFLNDVRDFYADSRVDSGAWNKSNLLYKSIYHYFKRKEKEQIEKCDGVICLTKAAEKIITTSPDYKSETPLEVIPCSVDLNLFDPEKMIDEKTAELKTQLNIGENDLVFSYLGSTGSWYLTDELMQFFKVVNQKIPAAKFLFISPDKHKTIAVAAKKAGLEKDKIIIKNTARAKVPALLSLSKFSVFFIKPCYSKQAASPTKHGEIMAMGIPVITNSGIGDVAAIIEKSSSGIVLKSFSEAEFEGVSKTIAGGISFDKNSIRNAAFEYYNLENAVDKYNKIYNSILK